MAQITIIYGSTTSNTESAAQEIATSLGTEGVRVIDVSSASRSNMESAEILILGTSTWGFGDLQDDWDAALSTLSGSNLSGKKVALFGCGDSSSYPDTFVDGMYSLYEAARGAGATIIGEVSAATYNHLSSRAEIDGMFVGLALDDDEMSEKSSKIASWVANISNQF